MKPWVSEELIKEFLNALNDCEFARFAPGDENQAMDKVYSSSIEVIKQNGEFNKTLTQKRLCHEKILFLYYYQCR